VAIHLSKPVAKWIAEVAVIALGILLATSAESLWQERTDRQEEVRYLIALAEDFNYSLVLREDREARQSASTEALQSLLQGKA